jgi:hypothetical protein
MAQTSHGDKAGFLSNLCDFFKTGSETNELLWAISTHGGDWGSQYSNGTQGQIIVVGDGQYVWDHELVGKINECLPKSTKLWMIIDACYSGGMFNVFGLDDRLDRKVISWSAASSEIVGWGVGGGGILTQQFIAAAAPGKLAAKLSDDMFEGCDDKYVKYFESKNYYVTLEAKYSRPAIASIPFVCK